MDSELAALEERLAQVVQRLKALREENRDLRQQLAARTDENARLGEKLNAARSRIDFDGFSASIASLFSQRPIERSVRTIAGAIALARMR